MTRSRIVCAIGLALLASWVSLAITLPLLGIMPESPVMQSWPTGANNRAQTAVLLITKQPDLATASRAARVARHVLAEEPVNVLAARTLGLASAVRGDNAAAVKIFHFAESLSRRDKPTQLFLIEEEVQRGDVAGALLHYDRVLRNSPDLRDTLFPILRGAAQDPGVAPQLATLVARRPLWWAWFVRSLVNDPADSSQFLYSVAVRMRPSLAVPAEREFLIGTITRLVAAGQGKKALTLYQAATGVRTGPAIRDGSFEHSPVVPPLDWQFTENDGFGATREAGDDGTTVLKLNSSVSQGGIAARQAILLPVGSYRLTLRAGGIDPALRVRPTIRISCQPSGRELLAFELHAPGTGQVLTSPAFDVPAGCVVQWLDVGLSASESVMGDETTPWIDDLSIAAIRP